METFKVESVLIKAGYDKTFDYIASPGNLPEWTHAFKSALNGKAVMATPRGTVDVDLEVNSSPVRGTIDWRMRFPDGNEANAYSA